MSVIKDFTISTTASSPISYGYDSIDGAWVSRSEKWKIELQAINRGVYGYGYGLPSNFQTPSSIVPNPLDYFNVLGVTGSSLGYGISGTEGSPLGSYTFGWGYEFSPSIVANDQDEIQIKAIVTEFDIPQANIEVIFQSTPGVTLSRNSVITDSNGEAYISAKMDYNSFVRKQIKSTTVSSVTGEFLGFGVRTDKSPSSEGYPQKVINRYTINGEILFQITNFVNDPLIDDLVGNGFPLGSTNKASYDDFKLNISNVTVDTNYNSDFLSIVFSSISNLGWADIWYKYNDDDDTVPASGLPLGSNFEVQFLKATEVASEVLKTVEKDIDIPLNGFFSIKGFINKRPEDNEGVNDISTISNQLFISDSTFSVNVGTYSYQYGFSTL